MPSKAPPHPAPLLHSMEERELHPQFQGQCQDASAGQTHLIYAEIAGDVYRGAEAHSAVSPNCIRPARRNSEAPAVLTRCGLQIRDTAEYNSALHLDASALTETIGIRAGVRKKSYTPYTPLFGVIHFDSVLDSVIEGQNFKFPANV